SSRCASSFAVTRNLFHLFSPSGTSAQHLPVRASPSAADKRLCILRSRPSLAPPAPDSPPPACPAHRTSRRSSLPALPLAALSVVVAPSAAVDVPLISCLSMVCRSSPHGPW